MKVEEHPLFADAVACGLEPHCHGTPPKESVWIKGRNGDCRPIDEFMEVIAEAIYSEAEED